MDITGYFRVLASPRTTTVDSMEHPQHVVVVLLDSLNRHTLVSDHPHVFETGGGPAQRSVRDLFRFPSRLAL